MKQYDRFFKLAMTQAKKILNNIDKMKELAGEAFKKASVSAKLKDLLVQIRGMARMVKEVASGRYKDYSKGALTLIVASLVYLVCPVDAIPDVIPVVGLVDDAAVLTFVLSKTDKELKRFLVWEGANN